MAYMAILGSRPCQNRWMSCEISVSSAWVANILNSETYLSTGLDSCLRACNCHRAFSSILNS